MESVLIILGTILLGRLVMRAIDKHVAKREAQRRAKDPRWWESSGDLLQGMVVFVIWLVAYTALGGEGTAHASTLGFSTVLVSIFKELQVVGGVCFGGSLVVMGIEFVFLRHLENIGRYMAATGIGGGLIGGGMGTIGLVGSAAGAGLSVGVGSSEGGDVLGAVLFQMLVWSSLALVWLEVRRYGRA